MPSSSFALAITELVYYLSSTLPLLYCLYSHRQTGLTGWLFLFLFTALQIIGSALSLSAGPNGTPSTISTIITGVGLSPLLLGIAGLIHEWANLAGVTRTPAAKKKAMIFALLFHVVVITAIAVYAIGLSNEASNPAKAEAKPLAETGVVLLLISWGTVVLVFGLIASKIGTRIARPLVWGLIFSLIVLGIRIIYACVSIFSNVRAMNSVTGSITLKVVFQFLPGAVIIAAMTAAGVMTSHVEQISDEKVAGDYKSGEGLRRRCNVLLFMWFGSDVMP
ncbi:Hypothetical protein R9X50_00454200 [Acrodontium crateriforme]|uniref:DUF7702 domain-containing protein n=1 Tax=Acrodontium crateriforme TaxID=150365 RepID=A0AAQ3M5I9_9PEZI|nr:Hypothetical protein R9X50_00454200 [Acrodontium crateriforme]